MKINKLALFVSIALLSACGAENAKRDMAKVEPQTQAAAKTPTSQAAVAAPEAAVSASAVMAMAAEPDVASPEPAAATPMENPSSDPAPARQSNSPAPAVSASAPTEIITHAVSSTRPMVITADLTFRTPDVRKTALAIEQLAAKQGGFVVSNQTNTDMVSSQAFEQSDGMLLIIENYVSKTDLLVRVPRQNAQTFLHSLQPHIDLLQAQNFSAEDVGSLLQRQLLAAQREQQRSKDLGHLNQYTRGNQDERRATIEAQYQAKEQEDEARIQQSELQDKIKFATINLHFSQPEQLVKHTKPNPEAAAREHRPSFWQSAKLAMLSSWHAILAIVLFLLNTWFVWAAIVGGIYGIRRYRQRVPTITEFEVQEWTAEEEPKPSRRRNKFKIQRDDE